MQILESTIPHINQLARLTEALRGNYTLEEEEYNEWNEWAKMKDEEDEAQYMRDQRTIRRELRDWGRETNPDFEMDEELEKRHDALISKPRNEPAEEADEVSDQDDLIWEERHRLERKVKKDVNRRSITKQPAARKPRPLKREITHKYDDECPMRKQPVSKKPRCQGIEEDVIKHDVVHSIEMQSVAHKIKPTESEKTLKLKKREDTRNGDDGDSNAKQSSVKKREAQRYNDNSSLRQQPAPKTLRLRKNEDRHNQSQNTVLLQSDETQAVQYSEDKPAAKASYRNSKETKTRKTTKKEPNDPPEFDPHSKSTARLVGKPDGARLSRPVRKCHDCKETTNQYRKCSYWQIKGNTGNKCGKTFCIKCLSSKYTLGGDVLGDENPNGISIDDIIENGKHDSEWFCPSCLQTCLCDVCVKQRQREEEKKAKNRDQGERRSRRSTEQTDYSNFFQANGGGISFF